MPEATDWELDAVLLSEWLAGDQAAGERLFVRHGHAVIRFFRNKVRPQDAEELAQETFLRLVKRREQIRDGRTVRAYLLGTARWVLLEHLREVSAPHVLDPSVDQVADLVPGASTILARCEEQQLIVNALRHISLDHQILLELVYWEQLNATALARMMAVNASTMRTRIQTAREALRAAIRRLTAYPELIESTLAGLDDWAAQIRAEHLRGDDAEVEHHGQR